MNTLYLDLETFNEVPLSYGTTRYAQTAEVMLVSYAVDDDPVNVVDLTADRFYDKALQSALYDEGVPIVAHNAFFDRTVWRNAMLQRDNPINPNRWRCSMARALAHGLPGALDKLGEIFGLSEDEKKIKEGKQLVQLFCKPRPKTSKLRRATRETHPEEWRRFIEYARRDVETMRTLWKKMLDWNYGKNPKELALWQLDQRINDRGFCIDQELCYGAIRAVAREQVKLAGETAHLTAGEVQSTTQRDALLAHILEEHSVELPDMRADTLERRLEDQELPAIVRELILNRLQASGTSVRKYQRALNAAVGGRVSGALQFAGAARTARWAGRIVQPQNFPRPWMKQPEIEIAIEAMKHNCEDLLYG